MAIASTGGNGLVIGNTRYNRLATTKIGGNGLDLSSVHEIVNLLLPTQDIVNCLLPVQDIMDWAFMNKIG